MTAAPTIKGWCPGALRPMQSGDGLVTRIRPPLGRLTARQAEAIAMASRTHGNGTLDLSARANLQLRGVTVASHPALIADLRLHGLIDPDIETETLRNLIVTPFRSPPTSSPPYSGGRGAPKSDVSCDPDRASLPSPSWGGDGGGGRSAGTFAETPAETEDSLAETLTATLARMPPLPGKFGFALDTGPRPVLTAASADIRVERAADGRLILRPDGLPLGKPVTDLAADTLALADWFLASGGVTDGRGRMAALIARGIIPPGCDTAPATPLPQPAPGLYPDGALVALAFGQMQAETLSALAALGRDIRPTPWRMLLLVGATRLPDIPGVITDPADPILRVTACTGAPGCPQALGETRALARSLAARLPRGANLHVSGCTKGCAHPGVSDLTLVATAKGYDLVQGGTAQDTPMHRALMPSAIPDHLPDHTKAPNAPSL
jgi:precorrin-3B synthase